MLTNGHPERSQLYLAGNIPREGSILNFEAKSFAGTRIGESGVVVAQDDPFENDFSTAIPRFSVIAQPNPGRRLELRAGVLDAIALDFRYSFVSFPSTRRQIPRGLPSRSSSGSASAGKPCQQTGLAHLVIAAVPTLVTRLSVVAG